MKLPVTRRLRAGVAECTATSQNVIDKEKLVPEDDWIGNHVTCNSSQDANIWLQVAGTGEKNTGW